MGCGRYAIAARTFSERREAASRQPHKLEIACSSQAARIAFLLVAYGESRLAGLAVPGSRGKLPRPFSSMELSMSTSWLPPTDTPQPESWIGWCRQVNGGRWKILVHGPTYEIAFNRLLDANLPNGGHHEYIVLPQGETPQDAKKRRRGR